MNYGHLNYNHYVKNIKFWPYISTMLKIQQIQKGFSSEEFIMCIRYISLQCHHYNGTIVDYSSLYSLLQQQIDNFSSSLQCIRTDMVYSFLANHNTVYVETFLRFYILFVRFNSTLTLCVYCTNPPHNNMYFIFEIIYQYENVSVLYF